MSSGGEIDIRTFALRQLARREMSAHQLRTKLVRRFPDADDQTLDTVITDLMGRKFLDDGRFASLLVSENRERGRAWLEAKLKGAGVDGELASETLDAITWPTLRQAVDDRMARMKLNPPLRPGDAARLYRALARLGYDSDEIQQELERLI
jgi:SOS response regulatory protein OraA/RecX